MIDHYGRLRIPAYNSRHLDNRAMGKFDPMLSVVLLHRTVADALATSDEGLITDVVPAGDPILIPFATYLHETIHWWQHIGTTSGMHYAMCIPSQALITLPYLREVRADLEKSLINSLNEHDEEANAATLACRRWMELELGSALIFDPRLTAKVLSSDPRYYNSVGETLISSMISTSWNLSQIADRRFAGMMDPRQWLDPLDQLVADNAPCFTRGEIVEIPIGLKEIFEGQARVSELQYLSRAYQRRTWGQIRVDGALSGDYGYAFQIFLKYSELESPEFADDWQVNLFLLVCDIAVSPDEGYTRPLVFDHELFYRLHPGVRFLKLCRAVLAHSTLSQILRCPSEVAYRSASRILCDTLGWPDPAIVTAESIKSMESMSTFDCVKSQAAFEGFGPTDVPILFFLSERYRFLQSRRDFPHFFCWPGIFLTISDGDESQAQYSMSLLAKHSPPFQSNTMERIDTIHLPGMSLSHKGRFVSDYFGTLVLYDLSRQWISAEGPFSLMYAWKGDLSSEERNTILGRFEASFKVGLWDIPFRV